MANRSKFVAHILDKLGGPLMTAVCEVSARSGEASDGKQEAQQVAALIGKAVQVSISVFNAMDIKAADGDSDAVRLTLAALAGPLVAEHYKLTGKIPGDNDVKRFTAALEAVLTFSDNFAPVAEGEMRLAAMDVGAPADNIQVDIQYIGALVPVINAISAYSFGRPEQKLVQDVTDRLVISAGAAARKIVGEAVEAKDLKSAELVILKAMATIYAECHQQETDRIMAMDDSAREAATQAGGGALSLDPVWDAFDRRASMLEMLGVGAGPSKKDSLAPTPKEAAPVAPAAAQEESQGQTVTPQQQGAPSAAEPKEGPPAEAAPSDNPMSMFASKPDEAPAPAEEEKPPPEPPAPQPPAAAEQAQEESSPPEPAPAEAEPKEEENYNPMSMFAAKPKDGEEE